MKPSVHTRPVFQRLSTVLLLGLPLLAYDRPALSDPVRTTLRQDAAQLKQNLQAITNTDVLGPKWGGVVVDLSTKRELFSVRGDNPLNPASNVKLVTTAAALNQLGSEFRMRTGVYGLPDEEGHVPTLTLRGFGDPTLRTADLLALAEEVANQGVRSADEVVVDGSYFDDQVLPPGFEQKPGEYSPFRAAVAAVSVNASAYTLRVLPPVSIGTPPVVRLLGKSHFDVENELTVSSSPEPEVVVDQRPFGNRLRIHITGSIPEGIRGVSYHRRIENPLAYAGYVFVESLRRNGIRIPDQVRLGPVTGSPILLATRVSPPLREILYELGKDSDNFVAEMVLKVLAAERRGRPGRSSVGAAIVMEYLRRLGMPRAKLVNGSGLFRGNLLSPLDLVKVLEDAYENPHVRTEYLAHLAIGATDGTLAHRFQKVPHAKAIRAKTGTLDDVVSLSGYVLSQTGRNDLAFSFIANDVRGKQHAARQLFDQAVEQLVNFVYGSNETAAH